MSPMKISPLKKVNEANNVGQSVVLEPASTKLNMQFGNYKLENHLTKRQQMPAILE